MEKQESYNHLLGFRRRLDLTQKQLADLIGVDPNYISMIESGKKPLSDKMMKKLELVGKNITSMNLKEDGVLYGTTKCSACTEKDMEIKRLKVDNSRLIYIVESLTKKLEQMGG